MRLLRHILCALLFVTTSFAETININWVDGYTTYAQTTCEIGGDIILPTPPTKRGYTFKGWVVEYTRLEYIKSNGGAYIDTQYHPVKGTHIYFTIIPYSANGLYFGLQNDLNLHSMNNRQIRSCGVIIGQYVIGQEIEVELWRDSDNYRNIKVDGNYYQGSTATAGGNIWLFADSGGTSSDQALKEVLITTDGVNSMNFIPVKRNIDGAVGMYDLVEGKFYGNDGTGEFIAGPVAGNQILDE